MSFDRDLLRRIVEGALLAAGEPLSRDKLMSLFLDDDEQPEKADVLAVLEDIQADCEGRGYELKEVGSGWRFQVVEDVAPWVNRLWDEKPQKYSRAMLETLALIAYRQPITRGDIEEIRGVAVSSHIIKTLTERDWIKVVGHRDVPGRPSLYATTRQFLDYFNLKSLDELPTLSEIADLDKLNAELDFETDKNLEAAGVATDNQAVSGDQQATESAGNDAPSSEGGAEVPYAELEKESGDSERETGADAEVSEDVADRDPNEFSYEEALAEERRQSAMENDVEGDDALSSEESSLGNLEDDDTDALTSPSEEGQDTTVEEDGAADSEVASVTQQDYSQLGSSLFGEATDVDGDSAELEEEVAASEEASDVAENLADDNADEPLPGNTVVDEDDTQSEESSGKSLFDAPLD